MPLTPQRRNPRHTARFVRYLDMEGKNMSNYTDHARAEFRAAGWTDENGKFDCDMQELLCTQVCDLLTLFGEHGHSGSTAPYAVDLFNALALFKPIRPLTGEEWEWNEVGDGLFQNNRCSHVFKEDGDAYDCHGKVFRDPNGSCWTSSASRVPVTFPYTPKTEYVDVEEEEEPMRPDGDG